MIPSFPGLSHCRQHGGRRGDGQSPGRQDICHLGDTSGGGSYAGGVHLGLIAIVVSEYDPAIRFFVDVLGFELVEDSPALTNDGRPKRWVVVRPPGAATGLLLARADGEDQAAVIGKQAADRVGFFLYVEDFGAAYARMQGAGVRFLGPPRSEPYGRVAVFLDLAGNKWDLIGP
jgi:catechol 2,3-dioxygenase-like lactoylglutathione lyase family enzyme